MSLVERMLSHILLILLPLGRSLTNLSLSLFPMWNHQQGYNCDDDNDDDDDDEIESSLKFTIWLCRNQILTNRSKFFKIQNTSISLTKFETKSHELQWLISIHETFINVSFLSHQVVLIQGSREGTNASRHHSFLSLCCYAAAGINPYVAVVLSRRYWYSYTVICRPLVTILKAILNRRIFIPTCLSPILFLHEVSTCQVKRIYRFYLITDC